MYPVVPTLSGIVENKNSPLILPFNDAMEATGFGKFNVLTVLFTGLMLVGMVAETLGLSYIIPAAQCDLELTAAMKGYLAAIPFIGVILTSHTWGYLADTRGRKWSLAVSMSVGCTLSILSSLSPNLIVFTIVRFLAGLFISGPTALGFAYLGEVNPVSHRDKMLTIGTAFMCLGITVVPLIAWSILPSSVHLDLRYIVFRPWRLLVVAYALPYLICSILLTALPETPTFLAAQGRENEALSTLKWIYSINYGKPESHFPVMNIISDITKKKDASFIMQVWHQTAPLFYFKYIKQTFNTFFLQFGIFATVNGFYIWFPAILNQIANFQANGGGEHLNICNIVNYKPNITDNLINATSITAVADPSCSDQLETSAFTLCFAVSLSTTVVTVASAFIIRSVGRRNVLLFIFGISAISALVIHWVTDITGFIVVFALIQICGAGVGIVNGYIAEIFPTNIGAMAVCLALMFGRVGSVVGTNVVGYLLFSACSASFFSCAALLAICFGLCFALPTDVKKQHESNEKSNEAEGDIDSRL